MVQKIKLIPGKLRTQEAVKKKAETKQAIKKPSITSAASNLAPEINLGIVFENDLLNLDKIREGTKDDYFKQHEIHLAKLFKIKPRASSSDTRPDLYLTSSQIDSLLTEKYGNLDYRDESIESSTITFLRNRLNNFEKSDLLKDLPLESSGIEVKGSQYGYELSGGRTGSATDFFGGKLNRQTPRSLSGRTLLSAYDNYTPAKGSEVISLAAAIANELSIGNRMDKNVYRRLNYEQRLEEDKRVATNIYNFLATGKNLSNFHKAMTGVTQDDKLMIKLAATPAARQVKAKGQELFMQYVTESVQDKIVKKTSYTAYLFDTFKYENTKVELSPTSIDFAYTTKYERAVVEKIVKLLTTGLSNALDKNISNTILKESQIGKFLGTVEDINDQSGKVNFQFKADTSGSLPIGKVKFNNQTVRRRLSGSAFTSRTLAVRQTLAQTREASMGDFVTDDTITALTKREMMRRMPVGPVGGTPLSNRVLTYRTGRFVQSLQVFADMRNMQMQYYYNPNYWIHESTSRDPRSLITASLNSVTRVLFNKRFNLTKSDSRGNQ